MLITTTTGKHSKPGFWTLALFLACALLLVTPIFFSSYRFDNWLGTFEFAVTSLVLALFLTGLRLASVHYRFLKPLFWTLLAFIFMIRLTLFLVLDFSGEGFTNNFYAHISLQAADVALREYTPTLILALLIFALFAKAISFSSGKTVVKPASALVTISVSFLLFIFIPVKSPEQQILYNYIQFQGLMNPGELSQQDIRELEQSGLVTLEGNDKSSIIATTGSNPENLILVYLESFHLAFTDDGPFVDLTPNINQLKGKYGHHSNWLSSADATMEAIISTQCGTLVSTPQGSNTFANTDSILPRLACLPDILHSAGYYQTFLGGFDKNFSGKNLFLKDHSYDEVIGWEEWQQQGFKSRDGYWGLPDDELFIQAVKRSRELASLASGQPYNLTLLTLSTHPPGFAASTCTPYAANPNDSKLLEAIHCTDQLVGKFVEQLQAENLLENTLLVITGDHDIFNLPEVREHFPELSTDPRLLNLIIAPDQSFSYPKQVNIAYDMAPTLLDLLHINHNIRFIWGTSTFAERQYHVSRRFWGGDTDKLEFPDPGLGYCSTQGEGITIPLDDCEHKRLLKLADSYLYGFYAQKTVPPGLCDADNELQVEVKTGPEPISIKVLGSELANYFAYNGRPLKPEIAGFYLFIKASASTASNFYYYGLDHVYWQMQMVKTLMELDISDQFVLVYKPGNELEIIEPLEHLLLNYGFKQQNLEQPFILVTNGDPDASQVFHERGELGVVIKLHSKKCELLIKADPGNSVIERDIIDELLTPYINKFPDI